jgi:hypothetical protein
VMDTLGNNMQQLTFNQAHDMDSAFLPNGQIVFSRWDSAATTDHVALYRMNPDGSGVELLYGKQNSTHARGNNLAGTINPPPIQFLMPRLFPNGQLGALVRPFTGTDNGGDLVMIDYANYVEFEQPSSPNGGTGPGHTRATPAIAVSTAPGRSPGGRFRSVFPLSDGSNRLLVSWSQCRVTNGDTVLPCTAQNLAITPALPEAQPLYGIYIYDLSANTQLPIVVPEEGVIMADVVAAAPRTSPPLILDRIGGVDYASQLDTQASGIIDIRSVYDIRGEDTTTGGIGPLRNPATTTAAQRPARFLRIEKAVSLPNNMVRNIRRSSFSPIEGNEGRFMREIIGYAPIEPDGSVRVKVPANVAFQVSILDENGRRISANVVGRSDLHRNWLQLRPGQTLSCNGCHTPAPGTPGTSHGRLGAYGSANPGLPANTGGIFPNTVATLFGDFGQTMAQVRAQRMCPLNFGSSACSPSVNMVFYDYWTDPVAADRAADAPFGYCYTATATDVRIDPADTNITYNCADAGPTSNATALTTPTPVRDSCETNWASQCRVIINYVTHIQPLWEEDRLVDPMDPLSTNNACLTCHTPTDAMNAPRVPAGQLDLRGTQDADELDHLISYRNLLFERVAQELNDNMTALQDICLQRDPDTDVCILFDTVPAPMNALNARGSRFFTAINDATHAGFMTPAELRLISEWLDIGAQYYNDPFLAPTN